MTMHNKESRDKLREDIIGLKVVNLTYDEEDDYYSIELDNGTEFCFRWMSDLVLGT